jgi:hypothetical protein
MLEDRTAESLWPVRGNRAVAISDPGKRADSDTEEPNGESVRTKLFLTARAAGVANPGRR